MTVKLTSDLVEQGFRLLSYEFIQEDGSGNICIKVTAEIPGKDKSTITWIYKYSNNGQPEAVIVEKEISFKTSEHWSLRTREGRAYNLIWYPKDFDRGIQLITLGGRS